MKTGKFFIVSEGRETYLGPALVYVLTLPPGHAPVIACVEIPGPQKPESQRIVAAAEAALASLKQRLNPDFQILSLITDDAAFAELEVSTEFGSKRVIVIPDASMPPDLAHAKQIARLHFAQRLALLRLEAPHLPWTSTDIAAHAEALRRYGAMDLYDTTHPALAPAWREITRRKKLLLHVCCGPDAAGVIEQLKRDFDVVGFWYDPNIQPKDEHDKRLAAFERVAQIEGIPAIVGEYDAAQFLEKIRGLERTPERGAKCSVCYDLRLERAAVEARAQGCDLYATTLAISPHKVQAKLKNFGALNEKKYGVPYLARNFMKHDGFKDSVDYTRERGIYRQDYCGCWFSLHEGGTGARDLAAKLQLTQEDLAKTADYDNLENQFSSLKARGETKLGSDDYASSGSNKNFG